MTRLKTTKVQRFQCVEEEQKETGRADEVSEFVSTIGLGNG